MKKTTPNPYLSGIKSVLKIVQNIFTWIWTQLVKLAMLLAKLVQWVISTFGKAIVWVWGLSILSVLIASTAFYLVTAGLGNLDKTKINQIIIEKSTPFIEKAVEIELIEANRELERIKIK